MAKPKVFQILDEHTNKLNYLATYRGTSMTVANNHTDVHYILT